ncbi:mutanase [Podospora appendiculata]|uniref:Mutanase n=1 Tax=Podospora appendiculata TaxID=314037 RepID=A0AAE1CBZ7_9PEZI|nr:mutanase [Podospora appendiculata]
MPTTNYTQADWEVDIGLAQEAHIDAFALNIANDLVGVSPALQLAFYVASRKGFKLFFSFDYAGNGPWDKGDVIGLCTSYCNNPAYLHTNGGPLLTTFEGPDNATDWHDIKASTGCFFMPDWSSLGAKVALQQSSGVADGLFSWAGWAWGNLDMNTYTDASYWMYLKQAGSKPYMMPASPWFYTNLPGRPDFVEIISWNDYGESHYIGPLYDKAMEAFTIGKASFNYAAGMPHDGWRAFLPYLIDLYKLGTATVTKEGVQGWWRRAAAGACGHGDTTGNTASQLELEFAPTAILTDKVFFSALLGSAADVSVTVGGTALAAAWTWKPDDGIGIYHGSASFGSATGNVVITITRAGQAVVSVSPGTAGSIGPQSCVGGLQNWNAYVASNWASTAISKTPTRTIAQQKCINGTGYGAGFADLCAFSCKYGYCDNQACVCKAMGSPLPTPSATNPIGYPAAGLDASYSGLCNFDCAHGHCPAGVCSYTQSPLVIPAVSDFSPPACTGGSAIAGPTSPLGGLCGYACNFGFCPYLVCHCDGQGALHQTPAKIKGQTGKAADGVVDHGLCSFACERGYCPAPTCVNTTATAPSQGGGGVFQELDPGWDSFTGQHCYKTLCSSSAPSYDSTWQNMATGPFRDNCPSGQYRIVVCPINETPGECRWVGTPPFCNPTCDPGEVAIATSTHVTKSCIRGQQALCCKSQTQQIEVAKDYGGSTGWGCSGSLFGLPPRGTFRSDQALCCDNPENVNPFLPVPLEYLFPTLPPDTDIPSFSFKHIESTQFPNLPVGVLEPFGMVVIDGPADLVSSMSKRDGSHVEFLDCELTKKHDMTVHKARYICTDDSDESNCGDIHLGGAEGTVVKLPEECGYAMYGVVHTISESRDQRVSPELLRRLALRDTDTLPIVHELAFSYDFRNVRRASANDPVYVRIDYSSMSDWFYEVVDKPPSRKREAVGDRKIRKRFWSKSDDVWKARIAAVRNSTNEEEEELLPLAKLGFSNLIYQQTSDTCAALSSKRSLPNDGFLSVSLDGWVSSDLRWGYTMVGTISPSLNIEEAHGFFDARISSEGNLRVDGSGVLEIQGTLPTSQLFGVDGVTDYGWSQPGLVSFKPTLNLGVQMMGSGHFDA